MNISYVTNDIVLAVGSGDDYDSYSIVKVDAAKGFILIHDPSVNKDYEIVVREVEKQNRV